MYKNIAILWYGKEWQSTLRFLQKNGINDYNIAIFDQNSNLFTILAISYFIYLLYLAKKIMDTKENISIKIPLFIVMFIILINILYYIL